MKQNAQRKDSEDKLKNILIALNTDIAREVLDELNKVRNKDEKAQVKKDQLYKLITELSNITNLEQLQKGIQERDEIIKLQKNQIEIKKAYAQNLINQQFQHIGLFLTSMKYTFEENSITPQLNQIQQNQTQELTQFLNLQQQFAESQKKLFEFEIINVNQMDVLANRVQEDRENQERILQYLEIVIIKSEKFIKCGIDFQNSFAFNQLEQNIKDYVKKLLQVIQMSQSQLIKLKKILSDQLVQLTNYANSNQQLIQEIEKKNVEIKNFNEKNRIEKEKFEEQFNKMKLNLEKQTDEKIKQILQNQQLYNHIALKFQKFQEGLKSQLYIFNQAIIKGIIDQQAYFFKNGVLKIQQSWKLEDLQKLQKIKVPANVTELQQRLSDMRQFSILEPVKEQLQSFEDFAKNLEDQINKFLI